MLLRLAVKSYLVDDMYPKALLCFHVQKPLKRSGYFLSVFTFLHTKHVTNKRPKWKLANKKERVYRSFRLLQGKIAHLSIIHFFLSTYSEWVWKGKRWFWFIEYAILLWDTIWVKVEHTHSYADWSDEAALLFSVWLVYFRLFRGTKQAIRKSILQSPDLYLALRNDKQDRIMK